MSMPEDPRGLESESPHGPSEREGNVARAVLTRWAMAWETTVSAEDISGDGTLDQGTIERFASRARREYVRECPELRGAIRRGLVALRTTGIRLVGSYGSFAAGDAIRVAASIVELRSSSFELALRVTGSNAVDPPVANVRCSVILTDPDSDRPWIIPDAIRHEIITRERDAAHYG